MTLPQLVDPDAALLLGLAVALGGGLLIGLERRDEVDLQPAHGGGLHGVHVSQPLLFLWRHLLLQLFRLLGRGGHCGSAA